MSYLLQGGDVILKVVKCEKASAPSESVSIMRWDTNAENDELNFPLWLDWCDFFKIFFQAPHQPGQPGFKFTVAESCDRIKDEFQFLQAQYHR